MAKKNAGEEYAQGGLLAVQNTATLPGLDDYSDEERAARAAIDRVAAARRNVATCERNHQNALIAVQEAEERASIILGDLNEARALWDLLGTVMAGLQPLMQCDPSAVPAASAFTASETARAAGAGSEAFEPEP